MYIRACMHTYMHPSIHSSIRPSIHSTIHPSIDPSIHPSIHNVDTCTCICVYLSHIACGLCICGCGFLMHTLSTYCCMFGGCGMLVGIFPFQTRILAKRKQQSVAGKGSIALWSIFLCTLRIPSAVCQFVCVCTGDTDCNLQFYSEQ